MKKYLFLLPLLCFSAVVKAQTDTVAYKISKLPYKHVDALAKFVQGDFNAYISKTLQYNHVVKNSVKGQIILLMSIGADGSISNVVILKSLSPVIDQEVVKVVSASPKWQPAMLNGQKVSMDMVLNIAIAISGSNTATPPKAPVKQLLANNQPTALPVKAVNSAPSPTAIKAPPAVVNKPTLPVVKTRKPVATKPAALVAKKPQPILLKKPAITVAKKMATPVTKKPVIAKVTPPVIKKVIPPVVKKPVLPIAKKTLPPVAKKTAPPKPLPPVAKKAIAPPVKKLVLLVAKKPIPPAVKKADPPKLAPPVIKKVTPTVVKKPEPVVAKKPATPVVKKAVPPKIVPPVAKKVILPVAKKPLPVVDKKAIKPITNKPAPPKAAPIAKKAFTALPKKTEPLLAKKEKEPVIKKPKRKIMKQDLFNPSSKGAVFPGGGLPAFFKYLAGNISYPLGSKKANIEGKVLLSFVVEEDGSVNDVEIISSPADDLGQEAIRVLLASPKWKPAEQNGRKVPVSYQIPIKFTLTDKATN
ncbi:energy transducer TonB [Mucilaginibacter paludis]|uniref:TonB family protein n=1 Tax=Mucilaginibacter paludis DSM 18603 TaxID=714943 RepID=H1Y9W4_9SPHI|nr:energy transducer TonB [Mucilaginibacter paludis]EHQ31147.1 TonB family protein [Mucilaginibacter paludis DSM 18603]